MADEGESGGFQRSRVPLDQYSARLLPGEHRMGWRHQAGIGHANVDRFSLACVGEQWVEHATPPGAG